MKRITILIISVIALLIAVLGTRHNIYGCEWNSSTNNSALHKFFHGMYIRGYEPRHNDNYRGAWVMVTRDIRNKIATLECRKEYEDEATNEEIDRELTSLYHELYSLGIKLGYFVQYY